MELKPTLEERVAALEAALGQTLVQLNEVLKIVVAMMEKN